MCAGSLQYLCASHSTPQSCPAMDYMVHTVDGAQFLLSSTKEFPSRITVKADGAANFPSVARRLYRCLGHAWRHHAPVFTAFEATTSTTARITALIRRHRILEEDQLIIPDTELPALRRR